MPALGLQHPSDIDLIWPAHAPPPTDFSSYSSNGNQPQVSSTTDSQQQESSNMNGAAKVFSHLKEEKSNNNSIRLVPQTPYFSRPTAAKGVNAARQSNSNGRGAEEDCAQSFLARRQKFTSKNNKSNGTSGGSSTSNISNESSSNISRLSSTNNNHHTASNSRPSDSIIPTISNSNHDEPAHPKSLPVPVQSVPAHTAVSSHTLQVASSPKKHVKRLSLPPETETPSSQLSIVGDLTPFSVSYSVGGVK